MEVFVSHSMKDQLFLETISKTLVPHNIKLLIAEHEIDIKNTITDKIKEMILKCDFGLILLTNNGINSGFVREEIGYLEALNKPSLMVMAKGIEKQYGGFKYGIDYVEYEPDLPQVANEKVKEVLIKYWAEMENEKLIQAQNEEAKKQRSDFFIGMGVFIGVLALIFGD